MMGTPTKKCHKCFQKSLKQEAMTNFTTNIQKVDYNMASEKSHSLCLAFQENLMWIAVIEYCPCLNNLRPAKNTY